MEYLTNSDLNNNFLINNNTINHNHNHNHNSNNTICLSPTSLNFNNASSYYSPHLINFPPEQINTEFDHHQHQHHNENVKAKLNDKLLINTKLPTYHEISNNNNNNSGDIINPVNIHEDNFNSLNIVNSSINNKTGKKTRNSVKTPKQSIIQNKMKTSTINKNQLINKEINNNDNNIDLINTIETKDHLLYDTTLTSMKQPKKRGPKKKPLTKERETRLKNRRIRANARERSRMHGLNHALELLRRHVPTFSTTQRLKLLLMNKTPTPLEMALNLTDGLSQNTTNLIANTLQINPRILIQLQRQQSSSFLHHHDHHRHHEQQQQQQPANESSSHDKSEHNQANSLSLSLSSSSSSSSSSLSDELKCTVVTSNEPMNLLSPTSNTTINNNSSSNCYEKILNNQNSVIPNSWNINFNPVLMNFQSDNSNNNHSTVFYPNSITDWHQSNLLIPSVIPYNNSDNVHDKTNNQSMHNTNANINENIHNYEQSFLQMMNKSQF
ncbi:unnamed protein product [Schistosoma mattheei]|uniref:BHLH domain-containing protein n=1 Tax=Schistosoma mattheei TaxID=31246 RepID=A0AA85ATC8_9TREM|nr:unnamed protein product [Schistosoma mattheei]